MSVLDEARPDEGFDDEFDAWLDDEGEQSPPDEPPAPPADDALIRRVIDAVVVVCCAAFVFWQLHPELLLANTTPAGGDMGAHVWAFAELRDNLLPSGRIVGWTPDWYAGFPVFQFYMVVPFLAMVVLNVGLSGWAALLPVAVAVGLGVAAFRSSGTRRRWLLIAAGLVLLLGVSVPYGVAFKLVTVAGVTAMPASAYLFGRLARFPFPTPALLSVGVLMFLFDENFTIYGGNIASTLAGEFAFSISLALAIAYLGVLLHAMRTGTHRATAAVLLALTGLCHLLPCFFALAATVVFVLSFALSDVAQGARNARRAPVDDGTNWEAGPSGGHRIRRLAAGVWNVRLRAWWVVSMGAAAGLLAAFWVLPFYWRRTYLNDMGWEKTAVRADGESWWTWFSDKVAPVLVPSSPTDLRWVGAMALVGAVLSLAFRNRIGKALVALGFLLALGFMFVPQGRLWNARILPFWYLVLYLLAAVAVGELVRALAAIVSPRRGGTVRPVLWAAAPLVLLVFATIEGGQLHKFPGYSTNDEGEYVFLDRFEVGSRNFVTDWSRWNYTGYERKERYPEYRAVVDTMAEVGRTNGCGMAMWEYNSDQNNYGTPMAMMLLPHWTDGCIGSMEGLYFEASSTTPFHFLVQSELSTAPSRAQRRMPYREFDIDKGVEHLQLLGVRYYLAFTTAARNHPDLTEIASSTPWTVFEVADAPRVQALDHLPAVTTSGQHQEGNGAWLCATEDHDETCFGPALDWFQDSSQWDVALAATGPDEWPRVDYGDVPEKRPVTPAVVSDVEWGRQSISFTVDRPGTPVLVKASYFPNWKASGADGPYRVAPNLMVVVPTDTEVTLSYGRTSIDYLATLLSLLGVALLFVLHRRPPLALPMHQDDQDLTWTPAGAPVDRPDPAPAEDLTQWVEVGPPPAGPPTGPEPEVDVVEPNGAGPPTG